MPSFLAIVCFGLSASLIVALLVPRRNPDKQLKFRISVNKIIEDFLAWDPPTPTAEIRRQIALFMDGWHDRNETLLATHARRFRAAAVLMLAEVALWLLDLAVWS